MATVNISMAVGEKKNHSHHFDLPLFYIIISPFKGEGSLGFTSWKMMCLGDREGHNGNLAEKFLKNIIHYIYSYRVAILAVVTRQQSFLNLKNLSSFRVFKLLEP